MRLYEMHNFDDEDKHRIPNPLNNGNVPQEVYDFLDELDDIENEFHEALHNYEQGGNATQRIQQTRQEINKLGQIKEVPIKNLIPMEPTYDKSHVQGIMNKKTDPAIVYLHNGKMYIGDGNHRIIADYLNNKPTTMANVIDTKTIQSKTRQLDVDNI